MRGVSAIIVTILLLMISVSMASFAYIFFTQTFSEVAQTGSETVEHMTTSMLANMKIDSISYTNEKVYIRNTGKTDLTQFYVYVNDIPDSGASSPSSIVAGDTGEIDLSVDIGPGDVIKVSTAEGAIAIKSAPGGGGGGSYCGDGNCDSGECASGCSDCSVSDCCGNGNCDPMESPATCSSDCGGGSYCGDGTCDPGECASGCSDCSVSDCCGNGNCDPMESTISCPGDCGGGATYYDWGITDNSFSNTYPNDDIRCMHGRAPNLANMRIISVNLALTDSATAAVSIYFGGSENSPSGTSKQSEVLNQVFSTSGWKTFTLPSELVWPANTVTWICWKRSGTGRVYYSGSSSDAGNFYTSNGRYSFGTSPQNPATSFPSAISGGSFSSYWYSIYLTYYIA